MMRRLMALALAAACAAPAVHAAMELRSDSRSLFFGLMELGEDKTLSQAGAYHNEIICASTGGRPWFLKVNALGPLASGAEEIPLERFSWQLVRAEGTGGGASPGEYRPFDLIPDTVYISGPGEDAGQPVRLQLRYRLRLPDAVVSGSYQTTIRFTLTEVP